MTRLECCVPGCTAFGEHRRVFEITAEWMGLEQTTSESWFCCAHLDMLAAEDGPPFLDLVVVGKLRTP